GVFRLADDSHVGLHFQQSAQAGSDDAVIIGQDNRNRPVTCFCHVEVPWRCNGMKAKTSVPLPGADQTRTVPPSSMARSSIPKRPRPIPTPSLGENLCRSKPLPLSLTDKETSVAVRPRSIQTLLARACLATLVNASWATR